ncbi:helix-turn-helix domain-containing protein [Burkholderia cenocepacia]|nr:helix-turn-helix domain-containing protein [Burkholderia cenocepacia]MBR8172235.1 helix-turn-helix domain-containing protein [Burkholderia cenocepacia]
MPRSIPITSERYQRLRDQLIAMRMRAGLTQVELAKRLRIDQSNLSKIERGERYVDFLTYLDWCRACGASPTASVRRFVDQEDRDVPIGTFRVKLTRRTALRRSRPNVRYDSTPRVPHHNAMSTLNQQDFLKAAKDQLGITWDEFAAASNISPRALKTYRMPDSSKDFRPLPKLARAAVEQLLYEHKNKRPSI